MSERNEPPSLQGMFSQVLREIQSGLNRLEQSVNQATQRQGSGFPPPTDSSGPTQPETYTQPTPKTPPAPYYGQRWEYKVVYVDFRGQISSEGQQVTIGRGERRSRFVRLNLDELGQQGWELAGISPLGATENSYFVFKRPATGEPKTSDSTASAGQSVQVEEVEEGGPSAGPVAEL